MKLMQTKNRWLCNREQFNVINESLLLGKLVPVHVDLHANQKATTRSIAYNLYVGPPKRAPDASRTETVVNSRGPGPSGGVLMNSFPILNV